jgi:CRP-like cAMP-binding protein
MSKQAEFAVILKMNPMFADLGADELQRISGLCHTQQLGVGEVLFQKGDNGDALFGVRRGQIRIETGASDGSRLTLNFLGPGDLFGEVAVLDGQSRTADATAGEPTELFVLRREDFLSHLEREPLVAVKLIQLLCQRIRWMSERMEESVLQPLPVRLARRLCALASAVRLWPSSTATSPNRSPGPRKFRVSRLPSEAPVSIRIWPRRMANRASPGSPF